MLTPAQTTLIKENWQAVMPIADTVAQLFYWRLFEVDPTTQPLFDNADMTHQRDKLMQTLSLLVQNAEKIHTLTPMLEEMGRRHQQHGVEDHHYDTVGVALIWALEQGLGEAFTAPARTAWLSIYYLASKPMRRAARQAVKA